MSSGHSTITSICWAPRVRTTLLFPKLRFHLCVTDDNVIDDAVTNRRNPTLSQLWHNIYTYTYIHPGKRR